MRAEQGEEPPWRRDRLATPAVQGANREHQAPLQEKLTVRSEEGTGGIVDVRALGGGAVQLDDGEVASGHELTPVSVAHVEASDEEAVVTSSNLLDSILEG